MSRAVLAALMLFLGPPLFAAPEDKYFRRGIQALDLKEFAEAESELRTALQIDGHESRRKITISGNRFEWYLPHYFLGVALLSQGDLTGAHGAWSTSRSQQVVYGWRDFDRFDQAWNELVRRLPASRRPPLPPPSPPPPLPASSAPTVSPVAELQNLLAEAGKTLAAAGPPHLRSIGLFVSVGKAMSAARLELGRNQPRAAELMARRDALRKALAGLAARPPDRRSSDELSSDLIELSVQARAAGGVPDPELEATLDRLEVELRNNLPSRELLVRSELLLLRALYPSAFP